MNRVTARHSTDWLAANARFSPNERTYLGGQSSCTRSEANSDDESEYDELWCSHFVPHISTTQFSELILAQLTLVFIHLKSVFAPGKVTLMLLKIQPVHRLRPSLGRCCTAEETCK